ncbi:Rieske (2Fe-2S) protein [Paraburkholderia rhynchosiae]|uniref:(2Fe-2S)-binding protein n=1 Tax=Paraburkholderia rhynchosiae TaxID=487049 RepID=A0A2N7WI35_9BURK|nr:Rieske 2Fe-2S domain-containing protein [Paraburkholderia rhynchosiae]PMS29052.1 (2Fe-2S)-binding protein [Paraburkholderia rhynchosiae]CAB3651996.1 3-phenylpropionate/cinnamic acid dioxygenase ferredoxin subunit [Paraburkholderia rhynchosiae]
MSRRIVVGVAGELAPGQRKLAFIDGHSIVLFNIEGTLHAIDNTCPHNGAALSGGQLEGCMLRCPAHGLRFNLRTGCMAGTGGLSVTIFPVEIVDSKVLVTLDAPNAAPSQARAGSAAT